MAESANLSSSASSGPVSTDEFASYRALSTWAVLCFVLSLLSILSFAHWFFLWAFPVAAVATGALALRQIAGAPQDWTGVRLAQTGIGLAVFCFLGALGTDAYWDNGVRRAGRATAERFVAKLRAGELESAFWLTLPRGMRREAEKLELKSVPPELAQQYQTFREEFRTLALGLADGSSTIEFDLIEKTGDQAGEEVAAIVYKIHAPEGDSHLLVLTSTKHSSDTHGGSWFVSQHNTGYTPRSFQIRAPSGHGHSH